jgi:isoleucyl-tRNA synthetase
VREAVKKELERLRGKSDIGSALNAEVELYCDAERAAVLEPLAGELHFILITSKAAVLRLENAPGDALESGLAGLKLKVLVSAQPKCVRCWHQRADVGVRAEHPELCGRCVENVDGDGEVRCFA